MKQTYETVIKGYKEKVAYYTEEEVVIFNQSIEDLLGDIKVPKKYRAAVAYFYMVLHIKEYENEFMIN